MFVRLPPALDTRTNLALLPSIEAERRRGKVALNNSSGPYAFTSMYFCISATGAWARLGVGPEIPAFAITVSIALIPWVVFKVSIPETMDSDDAISIFTMMRRDPAAAGRAERDWDIEGSRTVTTTVVFGTER